MDEEYLKLFGNQPQQPQQQSPQNLNETQTWENLTKPRKEQNNQWQNLNETPNTQQYNINENLNDGWGNLDIQVETRVNGVQQQPNQQQMNPNPRRHMKADPNGLNQFMDDDLREVVKPPAPAPVQQPMTPPPVQNVQEVDVVSIEMFENMNSNAMMTFANDRMAKINPNDVKNNADDRQVRFIPLKS